MKTDELQLPTVVWQKWRLSAPQTHLWLIKVWFFASIFVVKIATIAKRQTVSYNAQKNSQLFIKLIRL
jgi:pyrroloquinoline quinone (PQQ) biosynthesis protein C